MMLGVCLLLLIPMLYVPVVDSLRPNYIECQDSNECPSEACCVLGMGRFSIPRCKAYQDINEACLAYNPQPFNTTVSYPDGLVIDLTNVYSKFCQCARGLACNGQTSTCQDPSADPKFNFLD